MRKCENVKSSWKSKAVVSMRRESFETYPGPKPIIKSSHPQLMLAQLTSAEVAQLKIYIGKFLEV